MGGYLPTKGVKLFGETVLERDAPEDYDRLRKLQVSVRELEEYVTAHELALAKSPDDVSAPSRRGIIAEAHGMIKAYRAEIRKLDEEGIYD
jgi:hypothetical protein